MDLFSVVAAYMVETAIDQDIFESCFPSSASAVDPNESNVNSS